MAPRRESSYARDATVHIETGSSPTVALDRALEASDFLTSVDLARAAGGRPPDRFRIAIKPNLVSEAGTDPALVEHLIRRLRERSYTDLTLVESRVEAGRGVLELAAAAGYSAQGYRIVDLSDEQVAFDYGGVLGQATAGRTWVEADYRLSFAKAKTRRRCFYSATLANVFGCLPRPDKLTSYAGPRHAYYECCVLVADRLPVHFGVVDAWQGVDARSAGRRQLGEILASVNPFALDWVVGEKMELDPSLNPVLQEALLRWGRIHVTREGNVTAWAPWSNVRPITVAGLELLEPLYRGPLRRFGGRRLSAWTVQ
ncbi:MAG: hypothetical protein QOE60_386 [Thermoleophilaceae bacterium]|nr:hypothetical protein [Thermoleophilaceae bacterium]